MERFKNHCTVISGFAFKSADLHDYDDIPIIKIGNISNGGNIDIKKETQYVSNEFLSIDKKYHINCGDILISLTGSHINQPNSMVGRSCRSYDTDTYLLNQRAGKVICNDDTNDDYMYYLLNLRAVKENIVNRAYGAANQVNVSPSDIMKIKWTFPDIIIQNRIGAILSNYDKLIFINTKRIKTLEQMAENLYKEWFVRFRFPGHENAEFENGIPKGWEIKRIGEIGKVVGGGTPSTEQSEYWNGDIPWLTPADMKSFDDIYISSGSTFITEEGLKKSSATMLPKDTVLLSSRAPIGYVGIAKNPICTNQGFKNVICNPTNILPEVLFYFFKKNKDLLECYASGSTFLEVSSGRLKKIKLIVPPLNIQQIFVDTISPWIKQTDALSEINNNLIKQRDLLLPRLMSGKLEV